MVTKIALHQCSGGLFMNAEFIRRVAIVGGVHGNEWTGIYLVKKFQQSPELVNRDSFETLTLLANPRAIATNQRYIDRDLNRCFEQQELSNPDLVVNYEDQQAKEIAKLLCPQDFPSDPTNSNLEWSPRPIPHQSNVDVIIDLHSSTANMGLTLLPISKDRFNLELCAYLSECYPDVHICFGERYGRESPMLRSLAPYGCTIEVGPVAQGVLSAHLFQQTEQLVQAILTYLEARNHGQQLQLPSNLSVYQAVGSVDYPKDSAGELQAAIHPRLQFKDYEPLSPGDPMFLTWTGETIPFQGQNVVFPVFINEAAYYEKQVAMILTEKFKVEIN
jgi:succinylglutamate desuccinylase